MKKVGETLQKARRRKRLTLERIEEKTKIRKEHLKALEEDRYQDLPSGAYIQGFIKNYAQVLGLEPNHLLAIFRRDYKSRTKTSFEWRLMNGFSWNPRLTWVAVFILISLIFLGYLFWQYHLLLTSPYRS